MRKLKHILLVAGVVATAAVTGCKTSGDGDSDLSAGRQVDDKNITAEIKNKLTEEPVYKFTEVDVRTFNGVVQLSGFVTSEDQKQRAGQVASHVPGVARVVNSIALKEGGTTPTGRSQGTMEPQPAPVTTPNTQGSQTPTETPSQTPSESSSESNP